VRDLPDQDLNLSAVFMRNWLPDQSESPLDSSSTRRTPEACEWEKDYEDVQRVCRQVGGVQLKAELLDLSNDYWMRVFEPAVGIWNEGGTPNPDVACNRYYTMLCGSLG
jgi:tRNA U34 2-thiouridine synthase MnmA/TrmU